MPTSSDDLQIELLGGFRVRVGAQIVEAGAFASRRAHELVALLALAPERRLLREQVLEQLWPHLDPDAGAANLRKAAHHARRALGDPAAVVLRGGRVVLFPDRVVATDLGRFLAAAASTTDAQACARLAAACPDDLLPDAPYEAWTQEPRRFCARSSPRCWAARAPGSACSRSSRPTRRPAAS